MFRIAFPTQLGNTRLLAAMRLFACCAVAACTTGAKADDHCPVCTAAVKADRVLFGVAKLKVAMKWCGLMGAPIIEDPSIVCRDNFKKALWNRHERASDCIWIPACNITLRSGAAAPKSSFERITDTNTFGGAGAVDIGSSCGSPDRKRELIPLMVACDMAWNSQPKGIVTLSIGEFIKANGLPCGIVGFGYPNSNSRAWAAIVDPTRFNDVDIVDNEQALAHEVGHALGLCHTNQSDCNDFTGAQHSGTNLMFPSAHVDATVLTENQCGRARGSAAIGTARVSGESAGLTRQASVRRCLLSGDTHLECRVDAGIDTLGEFQSPAGGFVDLYKVLVVESTALEDGDLYFCLGTDGLPDNFGQACYWLALDVDNNAATGASTNGVIPGSNLNGIDLAAQLCLFADEVTHLFLRATDGDFEIVQAPPGTVISDVRTVVTEFLFEDGAVVVPGFIELDLFVAPGAFDTLGLPPPGELFASGLRLQASSFGEVDLDGDGVFDIAIDLAPDEATVLDFPEIVFPDIDIDDQLVRGQTIDVSVTDMPPNLLLVGFLGNVLFEAGVETDDEGSAVFDLVVPEDQPLGPTLITVGVSHPDNAITADTIVTINDFPTIPTVTEWGLVVMALALLIVARVYFSRRNALRT